MKMLKQSDVDGLIHLHQSGQFALAENQAKILLEHFPQELILHNILGVSQEAQKKFKEAAESYRNALKIQPKFAEMQFNLGSALYQLGDSQGAIQHYQKAIQIKPDLVVAYFNLGIAYQNELEFDKALSAYQKAIELQPGFYEAYGNKGAVYLLQGDFDQAILFFQKSLNIQDHARGHFNLGNAYRNQGHLEKAIQSYLRAIEMSPNDAEVCSVLGDALWHQGKVPEANQYLRQAVVLDPENPIANYNLATFLHDNKKFHEAYAFYKASQLKDWEERALYCLYKTKQFDIFENELNSAILKKNTSPLLATLSTHFAKNFNKVDRYNFCPDPLHFVFHGQVEALKNPQDDLLKSLLHDINETEISERKQSRLVNGVQSSGNLFKRKESSFKRLAQEISLLIKKYYERFKDEDFMFIKAFPKNIEFSSSWFVKMQSGGHLSSHIHEEGWISGAVYLAIPQQKKHPDEGGIELSVDGDDYPRMHENFEKKLYLPQVGDVVFFPSSVFHRTIPFSSDEERICIAFDLKPANV
jgi:uncharacterized protein (TIGR02466 family)